jgi:hypothetical protein
MRFVSDRIATVLILVGFAVFFFLSYAGAAPDGVNVVVDANETKTSTGAYNLSSVPGGYVATMNITSTSQNPRWKAFVGQVEGTFTLDDSTGSTIYDWSTTATGGEVYATRNATTILWGSVQCANTTLMEFENGEMSHSNADDNITATFNGTTHDEFFVGSVNITTDTCPTLNTYIGNSTQDVSFEEIVLTDSSVDTSGNLIYVTIMEDDVTGFDGADYDFQMIVPENGGDGFTGSTAYYLYVELS